MPLCPAVSPSNVRCTHPEGHETPHRGASSTGHTVVWGYGGARRPSRMQTPSPRRRSTPQPILPNFGVVERCPETYSEGGYTFQCVKDLRHPGMLHRAGRMQWSTSPGEAYQGT